MTNSKRKDFFRALSSLFRVVSPYGINVIQHLHPFEFSGETDILPKLYLENAPASYREIAEAICLIVDEKYDEALTKLSALTAPDTSAEDAEQTVAYFQSNEARNGELYRAMALLLQGEDFDSAEVAIRSFLQSNTDRPDYAVSQLMRISYALEGGPPPTRADLQEITGFLIDQGYHRHPDVKKETQLHILDMHMGRFFKNHEFEEAQRFAEMVVAEYDEKILPCSFSLFALGYIHRSKGNLDTAEELFERLLENPSEKWQRVAKGELSSRYCQVLCSDDDQAASFSSMIPSTNV